MPKCSYCGKDYEFPRGVTLVKTDGTVLHLCSGKCRKNMEMKKRKVRWISKAVANPFSKQKKTKKQVKKKVKKAQKKRK